MGYFVTGATGFIGTHLIERLAKRNADIYVLVRRGSESKFDALVQRLGNASGRLTLIKGDLTKPLLGLRRDSIAKLQGKIKHFFHLAAHYDLMSDDESLQALVNVDGTRNAVKLASELKAGCFHYMSSVAVAGLFQGYWREDMFEEAENYQQPYFKTKHDAEGIVRRECAVPYRIYRPGVVVGHSKTGEISKVDGPYYVFKFIQKCRNAIPQWVPLVGLEGGRINMVPVDYVADAMDHLAHKRGLNKRCFHLIDPEPYRAGESLNIVAEAAHAPQFVMRINSRMFEIVPKSFRDLIFELPPVRRIIDLILRDLGLPKETFAYLNYPTRLECRDTLKELEGSGIACPRFESYAARIWDYWERNLDPDLFRDRTLSGAVRGKVVVITGASSGIGRASAIRVAQAGAHTVLVSRRQEVLEEVRAEIENSGGKAYVYPADISDMSSCDELVDAVIKDLGAIDVLVNNAGKSIRRSIKHSYDRFHDFERLMQTNYFGAIRLILRVLPHMAERESGHVVNVSTMGVLATPPRFAAYVASKSALDAFSRCVAAEYLDKNVHFTTINMPLVRTPMIAPTQHYQHVPALTVDEAADMVCEAIISQPKRIATRLGIFAQVMTTLFPRLADVIHNTAYKLFPDAKPGKAGEKPQEEVSSEALAFAALMRGIYW